MYYNNMFRDPGRPRVHWTLACQGISSSLEKCKGKCGTESTECRKIHWITHLLDSPHNHLRVVKPGWILAGSSGKHRQVENPFKSHWQGCSHGNEEGLFHVIWRWISSPEKNVSCSMAWEVYIRYQIPLITQYTVYKKIYTYILWTFCCTELQVERSLVSQHSLALTLLHWGLWVVFQCMTWGWTLAVVKIETFNPPHSGPGCLCRFVWSAVWYWKARQFSAVNV